MPKYHLFIIPLYFIFIDLLLIFGFLSFIFMLISLDLYGINILQLILNFLMIRG